MPLKNGTLIRCGNPECSAVFPYNQSYPIKAYCGDRCRRHAEVLRKRSGLGAFTVQANAVTGLDDGTLLEELSRRGYAVEIEKLAEDKKYEVKIRRFQGDFFRVGIISCSHFGSKYQQLTALREFYKVCNYYEIEKVLHAGDGIDGDGTVYPGQRYEMFLQGADPQRDYMIENYPHEEGTTTDMIGGNHCNSFVQSANSNVIEAVAKERKDINYLGEYGAFVDFECEGTTIKTYLMHGGGRAQPYARSYRLQKIVEGFTPENKPHIVFLGHWHVGCHIPQYRNVEAFLLGAFQAQTPNLKRLGIWPTTTALILEVYPDDTGIAKVRSEWLHWHIQREKDY
ncbi:MAG: metallophosphoesterase family protein [Sphaerochaeta sp.]|jgi:predicted phosphodiesterase|nr:metallophosphoesterase family protein [Sphaerochaeta sp.]